MPHSKILSQVFQVEFWCGKKQVWSTHRVDWEDNLKMKTTSKIRPQKWRQPQKWRWPQKWKRPKKWRRPEKWRRHQKWRRPQGWRWPKKWRRPQKWSWPKNWRRPQKLAHPSKIFLPWSSILRSFNNLNTFLSIFYMQNDPNLYS